LPQSELNQLELQFLLLNDFRLTISPRELQRYAEQLLLFSETRSNPSSPLDPSSLSSVKSPTGLTAPMQAMGAVDAYGGTFASSHSSGTTGYPKNGFRTPQVHPRQTSSASLATVASETDASDAETDLDGSTDDEPTIRPAHSSCSSDTLSMYSVASEDNADDDVREEDVGDHRMRSP
jgi:PHO85 cyclin-6/7